MKSVTRIVRRLLSAKFRRHVADIWGWLSSPPVVLIRMSDARFGRHIEIDGYVTAYSGYVKVLRGDPCCYCGREATTVDHIVPVSKGGPNSWINYTAACRQCNESKSSQSLLMFLRSRHTPYQPPRLSVSMKAAAKIKSVPKKSFKNFKEPNPLSELVNQWNQP